MQHDLLERLAAKVVVISFEPIDRLAGFLRRLETPAIGLVDVNRDVYSLYGVGRGSLTRIFGPKVWLDYAKRVAAGQRTRALPADPLQMGADFIIDRAGRVIIGHVAVDPTDRVDFDSALAALGVAAEAPPAPMPGARH